MGLPKCSARALISGSTNARSSTYSGQVHVQYIDQSRGRLKDLDCIMQKFPRVRTSSSADCKKAVHFSLEKSNRPKADKVPSESGGNRDAPAGLWRMIAHPFSVVSFEALRVTPSISVSPEPARRIWMAYTKSTLPRASTDRATQVHPLIQHRSAGVGHDRFSQPAWLRFVRCVLGVAGSHDGLHKVARGLHKVGRRKLCPLWQLLVVRLLGPITSCALVVLLLSISINISCNWI